MSTENERQQWRIDAANARADAADRRARASEEKSSNLFPLTGEPNATDW